MSYKQDANNIYEIGGGEGTDIAICCVTIHYDTIYYLPFFWDSKTERNAILRGAFASKNMVDNTVIIKQ